MKRVSVIIPCRNEQKYIGKVLESLAGQDYPKEYLEVFIVDGQSDDGTRAIVENFIKTNPWMKLLNNPLREVSPAMNLGISHSTGDIILRMDAHSAFPDFYISRLISWLEKLDADNVGGVIRTKPGSATLKARAIAHALSHPFGVGNSYFRTGVDEPREVDTVPFGCYKKSVFDKTGMYNTRLVRNQDIELNKRLKNQGGKIVLVPDVFCDYFSRENFSQLAENNFQNGRWVILATYITGTFSSLSLRHFIPLFFMLYLLAGPVLCSLSLLFMLPLLAYFLLSLLFSIRISSGKHPVLMIPLLIYSFLVLHVSYGAGSLAGLLEIPFKTKKAPA